jgi:hypothetical protein
MPTYLGLDPTLEFFCGTWFVRFIIVPHDAHAFRGETSCCF